MAKLRLTEDYLKRIPKKEYLHRYPEYWRVVEWHATPSPARRPGTLQELAKEISIHNSTISRWKLADCYFTDVQNATKRFIRDDLPDVMYSLRNKIFKEGNATEIRLFLEWATDHSAKIKIEHDGKIQTEDISDPEVRQLINKFDEALRKQLTEPKNGKP